MKKIKKYQKVKVICALSGGVDSSVAAALLKKQGFEVKGIFMRLCSLSRFLKVEQQAKKIAKILRIPFKVLDLRKEFKKEVIDYFLKEYQRGRTPNPCVICNKKIKFGLLLKKILAIKIDFLATGHYARLDFSKNNHYLLLRAKDKNKDQSYFLWQLNQKQFKNILFPLGNYTKREVRDLAKRLKLPTWNFPESQEVCFIETTINNFLAKYLKSKSGPIFDFNTNKKIGQHNGLFFYTIGQRKGLHFSGGPYYVVKKDLKKNALYIVPFPIRKGLYQKTLIVKKVNWIKTQEPKLPLRAQFQIRYHHQPVNGKIFKFNSKKREYQIIFSQPQRALTPGQSVVFYKGLELLGGGIIV